MKCSRVRTAISTFILGVVSVPVFTPVFDQWNEISVNAAQVVSESPLILDIYPTKRLPMRDDGGSGPDR